MRLRARLRRRSQELQRLVDEAEIRRLLACYSRAIDRRDYELLRSCYHPAAIDEHGVYDGDIDGFIDYLQAGSPARFESHFLGNQWIEVEGDVAWAETYALALRRFDQDGRAHDRMQHVRYLDRIEKRDGTWRIAHRAVSYGHGRVDPVSRSTDLSERHQRDQRDRTDRVYRLGDL